MSGCRRRSESRRASPRPSSMRQISPRRSPCSLVVPSVPRHNCETTTVSARAAPAQRKRTTMAYRINHIHLKAPDPRKTAEWYTRAFNFTIVNDETRVFGDRFVRCRSEDGGLMVNISGARTGETLGPGDASAHHGLEHFGFDSADIEADIARLESLGAKLLEGPIQIPNGGRIAFLRAPDDVRVELVEPRKAGIAGGCC